MNIMDLGSGADRLGVLFDRVLGLLGPDPASAAP